MSRFWCFLLSGTLIVKLLNLPVTGEILPKYDVSHSKCVQKVFQKHFLGTSVTVILPKFRANIGDTFVKGLHGLFTVTIIDKNIEINASQPLHKPSNILFLTESRLDLIDSIKYLKLVKTWNPLASVLIVLNNGMVNAKRKSVLNMSEIRKIFGLLMTERSIKVNLIVFDDHHIAKIFAWFPFDDESNCSNRVQITKLIGECLRDGYSKNGNFMINTNYTDSPIIPRTFNECPLHITVLRMEPYTVCNRSRTCDNGIEIRLFEMVANLLKLTLKLNIEETIDDTIYNRLLTRKSDLLVGGINPFTKIRNTRITHTVPYYQDDLTWCVFEASTMHLWWNIFLIFNPQAWGYFVLITFIAGTALYYFYKFYHRSENWWYCVAVGFFITVCVAVPLKPTNQLLRIYFMIFCIYGILATTTFNSFLMSTITKPVKFNQISTKEGLINNTVKLYAENETITFYGSGENELSEYFMQNVQSCIDANSCLKAFLTSPSHNIAVAASREHAMNYPMINESKIYCFQKSESIYVYPVAALVHEHFYLLEDINDQIQKIIESGLITKWESDIKLMKKPNIFNRAVSSFSLHNISGCIMALLIGYTLGSIAFALEIYFRSKQKATRNSQPAMWRVWEKILVTTERNAWPETVRYFRWKLHDIFVGTNKIYLARTD